MSETTAAAPGLGWPAADPVAHPAAGLGWPIVDPTTDQHSIDPHSTDPHSEEHA